MFLRYAHFAFMYLRSSSRELRDTPQLEVQNDHIVRPPKLPFILHKGYYKKNKEKSQVFLVGL